MTIQQQQSQLAIRTANHSRQLIRQQIAYNRLQIAIARKREKQNYLANIARGL